MRFIIEKWSTGRWSLGGQFIGPISISLCSAWPRKGENSETVQTHQPRGRTQKSWSPTLSIISAQTHLLGVREEGKRGEEWCYKGSSATADPGVGWVLLPADLLQPISEAPSRSFQACVRCSQGRSQGMKDAHVCAGYTWNEISRRHGLPQGETLLRRQQWPAVAWGWIAQYHHCLKRGIRRGATL